MNSLNNYLIPLFEPYLTGKIDIVFEVGSRDGLDALALSRYFDAHVFAVECNPQCLDQMRCNIKGDDRITIIDKAAWDKNATILFYPVVHTLHNNVIVPPNIGASSCFKSRPDYIQFYEQTTIQVDAIRLDEYCFEHQISSIDLICMDVQGAALHALKGFGNVLSTVRYLIVELERKEIYYGQDLFEDVVRYLDKFDFFLVEESYRDDWFSDFLFIRNGETSNH